MTSDDAVLFASLNIHEMFDRIVGLWSNTILSDKWGDIL